MDDTDRMVAFIKEVAELRRDLVRADDFGDPLTLELSGQEIASLTYALALSYISEWANGQNGHRKIMGMISATCSTMMTAANGEAIDDAINKILGEQNG